MKEEARTWQLKCRFTPTEKEKIFKYCEEHNITISDLVRISLEKVLEKAKND